MIQDFWQALYDDNGMYYIILLIIRRKCTPPVSTPLLSDKQQTACTCFGIEPVASCAHGEFSTTRSLWQFLYLYFFTNRRLTTLISHRLHSTSVFYDNFPLL